MTHAIIALALLGSHSSQPAADLVLATYRLAGRDIAAKVPKAQLALPRCKAVADGDWTVLFNENGECIGRILGGGGWDEVARLHALAKAKFDERTPLWRVRAVVMTRFDVLHQSPEGALLQRRSTLENSQVVASLEALARFAAVADAYGQGRYKVALDVSVENEPMRFGPMAQGQPFDARFCQKYFGPRVNGGTFESEDKVYRGPYDSVFFIHAGWQVDGEPAAFVNGMPVNGLAFAPNEDMSPGQDLSVELLNRWSADVAAAFRRRGVPTGALTRFGLAPDGNLLAYGCASLSTVSLASVSNRNRVSTEQLSAQLALNRDKPARPWSEVSDDPLGKLAVLDFNKTASDDPIQIVQDSEKCFVLAKIDFADFVGRHLKPNLEAVAVGWIPAAREVGKGEPAVVFLLNRDPGSANDIELLDLKGEITERGDPAVDSLPPIPTPARKAQTGYSYVLKPSDDPTSEDALIAKAAALSESSGQAERAEVVEMLSARFDAVKLNAAQAFARVKEPSAVKPLIDLLPGFNLRVVEIALRALQFQGGEQADQAIRRALLTGRYGYVQAVAAQLTAEKNNPKDAQHIAVLVASDNWTAWLAGAMALSRYDDENAQKFLQGFSRMTDPAVRLAVANGSNPSFKVPASNLLWTAVNDPSDLVRAAACLRLIQSDILTHREEGYKGVRDDSVFVRLQLLDFMESAPNPNHRKALQLAVADADPEVRATALTALGKMEGPIALAEIQNTLSDKDPRVQRALVELALAKELKLPAESLAALRSSLDPQVAARAKELAE